MAPLRIAPILLLAGCVPGGMAPDVAHLPTIPAIQIREDPPAAPPGTCWARDETPAEVETTTRRIEEQPARHASDGRQISAATYRTEITPRIVRERREIWFQTACPDAFTPDSIRTLQRALKARGFYSGEINGTLDTATRTAIRTFQRPQGLDSSILSLPAARQLGLVAVSGSRD